MDLDALLLDLSNIPDDGLRNYALKIYVKELEGCQIVDHEGNRVFFFSDRFDHAFYEKKDWKLIKKRDAPSRQRVERIRWIPHILGGLVPGTECWDKPASRAYVCWRRPYIIWLSPRQRGDWRFSTAYPCDKP